MNATLSRAARCVVLGVIFGLALAGSLAAAEARISTVAGTGVAGYGGDGGPATQAQLRQPHSIALDDRGFLYIADIGNHRIRRVHLAEGTIESIAGNGQWELPQADQPARQRPVLGPRALFLTGRTLWVALREGHSVWTLDLDDGRWQHVAGTGQSGYSGDGGPAAACTFNGPKGIAVDGQGNVYVADTENQTIRLIDSRSGIIRTLAGSGPQQRAFGGDQGVATDAQLNRPHGVCVSADGRTVIIGDSENHRVRQVMIVP
jgi:sugar lactone lactonase YvrE